MLKRGSLVVCVSLIGILGSHPLDCRCFCIISTAVVCEKILFEKGDVNVRRPSAVVEGKRSIYRTSSDVKQACNRLVDTNEIYHVPLAHN